MNYINKPIKPAAEDFKNGEDLIAAMAIYNDSLKKYEKQSELLSSEFSMVAMCFEKENDSRYSDRMEEINEIKYRAEKGWFPEQKLTTKIPTTPKRKTKTVLVTFRVEEELKERFTAYCEERNVSISTVLRDFMHWEMTHPFGEPD